MLLVVVNDLRARLLVGSLVSFGESFGGLLVGSLFNTGASFHWNDFDRVFLLFWHVDNNGTVQALRQELQALPLDFN